MARAVDSDDLPPLQYAVMEVLAARYRLGHEVWSMSTKVGAALRILERKGLLGYDYGIVENTYKVWLTDLGREAVLMDGYVAPVLTTGQVKTQLEALRENEHDGRVDLELVLRTLQLTLDEIDRLKRAR